MPSKMLIVWFAAILVGSGVAQTTTDIHLFQNYFSDAVITKVAYDEAFVDYRMYSFGSTSNIGLKGGFTPAPQLEINGELSLATLAQKDYDSNVGLSDLIISGRYLAYKQGPTAAAVGAKLALPFGDSDVGYGNGGFALFGALRQTLSAKSVLTAAAGLDIVPEHWGAQNSASTLSLGGGLVHRISAQTHLVTEAAIFSKIDYLVLSAGLDRLLNSGTHVRGMIGVGAANNAPDVWISLGYVFSF